MIFSVFVGRNNIYSSANGCQQTWRYYRNQKISVSSSEGFFDCVRTSVLIRKNDPHSPGRQTCRLPIFRLENSSFHHNPELEVIGFPKLTDIYTSDDHMEFSHNPKLKELQFPVLAFLTLFDGNASFLIWNRKYVKVI